MTRSVLDHPAPAYGQVTVYPRRRRARWVAAAVVVITMLCAVAAVAVRSYLTDDSRRTYLTTTTGWPVDGQAAYVLGDGPRTASPSQRPVPIASLAKMMTAYLVIRTFPLTGGHRTLTLDVTGADVADTEARRSQDQSVVEVRTGEHLSERDALLALLLPSANNVAVMLAREVAGDVGGFVRRMNDAARRLGMRHTHYSDPSGYDAATVSTARDQLLLAQAVADEPTLTELVAHRSARIPVAGTVHNTDALLGHDGFVGTKTGSHDAAGGCFMFRAHRRVGGRVVDLLGVVLGQHGHNLVDAGLYAARQLADRVAPAA